ncbi:DUF4870 family protein [Neisseria sp. S1]|uniref:DUF4870 family protein n=1 Tax=Neisseria sp. S1 TaxID=3318354 RepID=UPI003A8A6868
MDYRIIGHPGQAPKDDSRLRTYAIIVYALYAASLIIGFTLLAGVIMAYLKRNDAVGTPYYDQFAYLIKTFWVTVAGLFIGVLTIGVLVGGLILVLVSIWFVYRVVAGFIKLYDHRPISADSWF